MKTEDHAKSFNEQEYYLELLLEQIQCKKARETVKEEIRCHIEDQKTAYMADGMEEQEAEKEAVRQMGDPVETGIRLDKIHRPKMAWDMIILIAFLSGAGVLIQYLLSLHFDNASFMPEPGKSVIFCIVGMLVMLGVCFMDYTLIGKWAKRIYCILFGMELLAVIICTLHGIVNTYISGLAALYIPLYAGILYSFRGQGYRAIGKSILWMIPAGLMLVTLPNTSVRSTSMLMIMGISCMIMLSVAVYKGWFTVSRRLVLSVLWTVVLLVPIALAGMIVSGEPSYYQRRLQVWMHPFSQEADYWFRGFRPEFLAQNQWIGQNHLLESEHWGTLFPGGNDYTLAYVGCYYGILAAVILAGLILLLLIRAMNISLRQKNQLGMLMGIGVATLLLVQFVLYVLCNMGILPSSIYCPFITYGGSGLMTTSVLLGVLLSIYRYQNILGREYFSMRNVGNHV